MDDNVIEMKKSVDGWWAASSDADYEQIFLYEVTKNGDSLLDEYVVTKEDYPTLEDFKLMVKRELGGGVYVAVVRGAGGTFAKRHKFPLSGKPIREKAEEAQQSSQVSGMDRLAEVIAAGNANVMAVLAKMSEKPSGDDELARLERYASIVNKNTQPAAPVEKSMLEKAMEKKFLEFMESGLGGGAADDSGWAKELIGMFGPALMGALPAPASADEEGSETPPAEDAQAQALGKLKLLLTSMVQLAEFEVVPAKAVAGIEKKAGQYWPMLQQIIQRPDAVALAEQMVPAVSHHRPWFEAFRAAVIGGTVSEGGEGGSTGKKPAGSKKPAASNKPRAVGQRSRRNTADA